MKDNYIETMTAMEPFVRYQRGPGGEYQKKAQRLCWQFNQSDPDNVGHRVALIKELVGSYPENGFVLIRPPFNCDYGFNIHFHGFAILNFGCTILDTSPVHIGHGVFIAPGVCISCAGHALDPQQRIEGLSTSAPIVIENKVWIGANATICAGVTIGEGSVIGAGSVVTRDIPAGVVAAGVPCKVIRPLTENDVIPEAKITDNTRATNEY